MLFRLSILSLITFAFLIFGCGGAGETKNPNITSPPSAPSAAADSKGTSSSRPLNQVKDSVTFVLLSYYQDLANETLDPRVYFAPQLEKFFNTENPSRASVANSIQRGFNAVEDREINMDVSSLQIRPNGNGFIAEFEGDVSFVRSNDKSIVEESFVNRVGFDKDLKIISYEALQSSPISRARESLQPQALGPKEAIVKILAAFERGDKMGVNRFIHPEWGIYFITRPGAMDVVYTCKKIEEVYDNKYTPWAANRLSDLPCELREEALPKFDCESWSKEGCFLAKTGNFTELSGLMEALNQADPGRHAATELSGVKRAEKYVSHHLVITESMMSMAFGEIDGKWYLLMLDMARFDCSA